MKQVIIGMVEGPDGKNVTTYNRIPEEYINIRLTALQIAASVFSQLATVRQSSELIFPRPIKDFRESVDAVFKAAGLEEVDWE